MVNRSAGSGFLGMTDLFITKLLKQYDFKSLKQMPRTVIDKIILLLKAIFPGITPQEIHTIILRRIPTVGEKPLCAATSVGDQVMDDADLKEVKKVNASVEDSIISNKHWAELLVPGSKYIADLKEVPTMKKGASRSGVIKGAIDLIKMKRMSELRKFMPDIKGCHIQEINFKRSFTAFYPGVFPGSRTRTVGAHCSREQVIRHVISWAWKNHSKKTGSKCPYPMFA